MLFKQNTMVGGLPFQERSSRVKSFLLNLYKTFLLYLSLPVTLGDYLSHKTGKDYGLGRWAKIRLARRIMKNTKRVTTGSSFMEHLAMATRILRVPKNVEGALVECGCYKGGSSTNLSILAKLTGRKLIIFDSFEGLPEPTEADKAHFVVDQNQAHTYAKGAWAGRLDEVKGNIERCGELDACEFKKGFFDQSMPGFDEKIVFVFLDVDLVSSLETCLEHLWPLMQNDCYLFTHEAHHLEIAELFFDKSWWNERVQGHRAPGLVGAGCGLGLMPSFGRFRSAIGYAVKNPIEQRFEDAPQVGVIGADGNAL